MTGPRAEPSSHTMSCTKLNALYLRIPDRHCSAYRHIRLEWSSFHSGLDRDCADHALSPSRQREWCPIRPADAVRDGGASVMSQTLPSEVMIFMVPCGPASLTPSVTGPVMGVTSSTFPPQP